MYFCRKHRERFFRLEDTELMCPTYGMVAALEAEAAHHRLELELYASAVLERLDAT
jgi:hypothetical protein